MSDTTGTTATTGGQTSTSGTETTASTAAQTGASASGSTTEGQSTTQGGTTDGGTTTTTTAAETPWQDGLDGPLKENPLFRDYKSVSELAKAHEHLTKLKGAKANEILKIPAKPRDQDPEAWAAVDAVRGVPADPADYKIELAPEAASDAPALVATLRELGGKAKLDPHQMATVVETLNTLGKAADEAEVKALDAETKATTETLNNEWGTAAEGVRRGIGKLIREAIDASLVDIKDPAEKAAAAEAAAADLQTRLASNLTVSRVLAHALGKMAEPETPEGEAQRAAAARQLTPTAASAALNAFHADKDKMAALNDKKHPQHAAMLEERRGLLAMQRGDSRPDQAKT